VDTPLHLPAGSLFTGRLYLILDPDVAGNRSIEEIVNQALHRGVRVFQLRVKTPHSGEFYTVASQLAPVIHAVGGRFIVNDRCDVALAAGADGVHLGQDDLPVADARRLVGPQMLIGISTHNLAQALEAEASGADYIGFGPIFPSSTKNNPEPVVGIEQLRELRSRLRIPIVAIGGINATNIRAVADAGSEVPAVLSAVLAAADPNAAIAELLSALER
jgi:thiamine-phosphate pyrophosphorylase